MSRDRGGRERETEAIKSKRFLGKCCDLCLGFSESSLSED